VRRELLTPRPDWRAKVEALGLDFHTQDGEPYWWEAACYAFSAAEIAEFESGLGFPPRRHKGVFELPDGYLIDAYLPIANRENDYFIDRVMQREKTFTGITGINEQDRALQESFPGLPGARRGIVDRSREMLVASDLPIVKARRRMVSLARAIEKRIWPSEPHAAEHDAVREAEAFDDVKVGENPTGQEDFFPLLLA